MAASRRCGPATAAIVPVAGRWLPGEDSNLD
jgi:hypothetical protein